MVLLHCLSQLKDKFGLRISALHVNHGIREGEAVRDEKFCVDVCQKYGVTCIVKKVDVPRLASKTGMSLETAAREARYGIFEDVLLEYPHAYIATAHNATDNAETLLFRMARGTALRGLCGIPAKRGQVIRPLLGVSSAEIRRWAEEHGIAYVLDSTNQDVSYTRNFVRHELIPRLEMVHEGAIEHISCMVDSLSDDEAYLCQEARKLLGSSALRSTLANAHVAIACRALRYLYEEVQVSKDALTAEQLQEMLHVVKNGSKNAMVTLPCGVVLHIEGEYLFFTTGESHRALQQTPVFMGENILPNECGIFVLSTSPITLEIFPTLNVYRNLIYSCANSATIDGELYVRPKVDGDTYRYGGMTHKVKRLFSDRKLSLTMRRKWPLLCDSQGILWVPGFPVRDDSKKQDMPKLYFCYGFNSEDTYDQRS